MPPRAWSVCQPRGAIAKQDDCGIAVRAAAKQGEANADSSLGYLYSIRQGAKRDYAEALRSFTIAAEQANPAAQVNLGGMYENGRGVPLDYIQAYKLASRLSPKLMN